MKFLRALATPKLTYVDLFTTSLGVQALVDQAWVPAAAIFVVAVALKVSLSFVAEWKP